MSHKFTQQSFTGSDDAKVKIWSTNSQKSITTIEARANVCCVQFNPKSSMHVAFGGADHDLHYYDLRNPKQPLNVFKGHKKAVSYCKFVDKHHFGQFVLIGLILRCVCV